MDLNNQLYQDSEGAQQALRALSPFMVMFWTLAVIIVGAIAFGLKRLFDAKAAVERGAVVSGPVGKDGKLSGSDYAGLTKEEMKMLLDAEIKRRQEAGEDVTIRNVFEGPLDWDDVDEQGAPRVRAEKKVAYEEWLKEQSGTPPNAEK